MKRRLILGALFGFVLNFQSAYNPFYIHNFMHETHDLYYDKISEMQQDMLYKKEFALNESD